MLGGKYRDRIRIYCDTDVEGKHTGLDMGRALKARMDKGFTFLKMDLGLGILKNVPGTVCAPLGLMEEMNAFEGLSCPGAAAQSMMKRGRPKTGPTICSTFPIRLRGFM